MNLGEGFPSRWLKKTDLNNEGKDDTVLTIKSGTMETMGQGENQENKAVLWFNETDKGFVLSAKCNYDRIVDIFGTDDTSKLAGKRIALYFNPDVTFGNKTTGGVRIRDTEPDEPIPF